MGQTFSTEYQTGSGHFDKKLTNTQIIHNIESMFRSPNSTKIDSVSIQRTDHAMTTSAVAVDTIIKQHGGNGSNLSVIPKRQRFKSSPRANTNSIQDYAPRLEGGSTVQTTKKTKDQQMDKTKEYKKNHPQGQIFSQISTPVKPIINLTNKHSATLTGGFGLDSEDIRFVRNVIYQNGRGTEKDDLHHEIINSAPANKIFGGRTPNVSSLAPANQVFSATSADLPTLSGGVSLSSADQVFSATSASASPASANQVFSATSADLPTLSGGVSLSSADQVFSATSASASPASANQVFSATSADLPTLSGGVSLSSADQVFSATSASASSASAGRVFSATSADLPTLSGGATLAPANSEPTLGKGTVSDSVTLLRNFINKHPPIKSNTSDGKNDMTTHKPSQSGGCCGVDGTNDLKNFKDSLITHSHSMYSATSPDPSLVLNNMKGGAPKKKKNDEENDKEDDKEDDEENDKEDDKEDDEEDDEEEEDEDEEEDADQDGGSSEVNHDKGDTDSSKQKSSSSSDSDSDSRSSDSSSSSDSPSSSRGVNSASSGGATKFTQDVINKTMNRKLNKSKYLKNNGYKLTSNSERDYRITKNVIYSTPTSEMRSSVGGSDYLNSMRNRDRFM